MAGLRVLLAVLLALPALAQAVDLSGTWRGDDGGEYYLVQREAKLYWYAEQRATDPAWSNIFDGHLRGNQIRGNWTDVPKGQTRGHGRLELDIRKGGNLLVITSKTGGYGGNSLSRTRVSAEVAPMTPAKPARVNPPVAMNKPMPMRSVLKEDCIAFNWKNVTRTQLNGRWKIVEGSHWLFDFDDKKQEASQALRIIKRYHASHSCYVGRPDPSFRYLLSGDQAPSGPLSGEDCLGFDPGNATVKQIDGRWKIVDGSHWMFDFAGNEAEARQSLAVIKKYGFTHSCFVGRPDASFSYLRK